MKKALLPLICLLLFISCKKNHEGDTPAPKEDSLGTGWSKISVTKSYISDIFFSGNTGFLVSSSDGVYKSINSGDTWNKVYHSNASFINIGMGSPDNASFIWAVGTGSKYQILYTTNGGASFDSTDLGVNSFNDIFYVSPQVAYAMNGKLWKTVNGGKNWTSIYTFPNANSGNLSILYFLNEQTGWAGFNNILYKTVNSGLSWTPITNHGLTSSGAENALFFTDVNTGYFGNETIIKKTTDGGSNWSTVYTTADNGSYHNLHFINSQLGYLTDGSLIMKTTDGGATWTREVNLANNNAVELHFTDANHGWAGTGGGTILKFVK